MKRILMIFTLVVTFTGRGLFCGEPIMFIAIEKSASVAIQWQLIKSLNYEFKGVDQKDANGSLSIINQKGLAQYANCNCVLRGHYHPTKENIEVLKKHGIRVIFHVRDLRQRVVSFANYELSKIRVGISNPPIRKKRELITLNDMIEHMIPNVKHIVSVISGWLDVYKKGEIPMLITTYEEFHDQRRFFFEKILNFYEIPFSKFKNVETDKNENYKFRNGEIDEWRRVLTVDQQRRITEQIPDELFDFFGWDRS